MDRRSFLKQSAALTVVVASGQIWRSYGQQNDDIGSEPELEPWRTWQQDSGHGPLALVRAAILSSNAYNSQPWLFRVADTTIDVYADVRRNLGAFDPYLREMVFSLGCALENMLLAARAEGYEPGITYAPGQLTSMPADLKPLFVAQIDLQRGTRKVGELYKAIPHRHTNREPFDAERPLPSTFIRDLSRAAGDPSVRTFLFDGREQILAIAALIAKCSGEFLADKNVRASVQPWMRTTREQMRTFRDGVLLDPAASRSGTLEAYAGLMRRARLFGLIAVRDRYSREQTLSAGRIWQRAHLLATAHGIAARPANGAVELIDHERQLGIAPSAAARLAQLTGDESWQPTFMFYMGYAATQAKASPRRSIESVELTS